MKSYVLLKLFTVTESFLGRAPHSSCETYVAGIWHNCGY